MKKVDIVKNGNKLREIAKNKKALRKTVKEKQVLLTREYTEYADKEICRNILSMDEYKNAQAVFCFVGTKDEINTELILKQVLKDGKKLLVPKCRIGENGIMDAYEITHINQLETGAYGIMEPGEDARKAQICELEFAVIPCLACDKKGHRLGHGGGYYDRYLEKAVNCKKENCLQKVVICREQLILEQVPFEETDQSMDFVVSEKGIFRL